ncbi:MAG TPA: xanthine dehydrogenase [Chloroflexi bacterium]|nr:xanthine dehydrogenase [Chloroflexota bacterium]
MIGRRMPLADGLEKVTGRAKYAADVTLPGMLYARPILSPYAHARIVSIDTGEARSLPGVVAVLTGADLPAAARPPTNRNSVILARDRVIFEGHPVAVVVGESETAAQDGAEQVVIEYDPLSEVVDPLEAMHDDAPLVWPEGVPREAEHTAEVHAGAAAGGGEEETAGNIAATVHFHRGDVDAGLAEADLVVERTYRTNVVHQAYIESHAATALVDPFTGALTIWTSTQGQFMVRDEVARLLGLRKSQVRIIPTKVGGGFGAKYGIVEPLVGAIALHLRRPIQMVLSRNEDFASTTPSPACVVELKTGATRDGRLTALQARVVLDSGAFPSGLTAIFCNILGGYYRFPNLDIQGCEVLTNKPVAGAYRAPTAPQATFVIESQIDEMARELGLDALQFRLQNAIESGDQMPDGATWQSVGMKACLERVASHPLWRDQRSSSVHRGVGLAVGGWPGGTAPASAVCRPDGDGTIHIHVGSVDITGSNTSLVLLAAETLGVPPEHIQIIAGDTTQGPFAGPSGGSMTIYTLGSAVVRAADGVRQQILAVAADLLEADTADLELQNGWISVRGAPGRRIAVGDVVQKTLDFDSTYPPIISQGGSALTEQAPGFSVHLTEVAVDMETGRVSVTRNLIVQDVGRAINPLLIEGQVHGGATQGIGWALFEQMVFSEKGHLLTGSFLDYALPTARDVPPFEVILVENPAPNGPFGARGVGEPPIIAAAAAIANAIRDATGVRLTELPITAERLWQCLLQKGQR